MSTAGFSPSQKIQKQFKKRSSQSNIFLIIFHKKRIVQLQNQIMKSINQQSLFPRNIPIRISHMIKDCIQQMVILNPKQIALFFVKSYAIYSLIDNKIVLHKQLSNSLYSPVLLNDKMIVCCQKNIQALILLQIYTGQIIHSIKLDFFSVIEKEKYQYNLILFKNTKSFCLIKKTQIYSYVSYFENHQLNRGPIHKIKCQTLEKFNEDDTIINYTQRISNSINLKLMNLKQAKEYQYNIEHTYESSILMYANQISPSEILLGYNTNNIVKCNYLSYWCIFNTQQNTITLIMRNQYQILRFIFTDYQQHIVCVQDYKKTQNHKKIQTLTFINFRNLHKYSLQVDSEEKMTQYQDGVLITYTAPIKQIPHNQFILIKLFKKQSYIMHLMLSLKLDEEYGNQILQQVLKCFK